MKRTLKGFAVVSVLLLLLTSSMAIAGGYNQVIEVVFNSVNIAVNGQTVAADNIFYNGTTYVPLRKVAEMFGKDVGWDAATNTASINDKGTPVPTQPPVGYGRSNPAPIGVAQRITVDDFLGTYTAEITVKEAIRGSSAWSKVKAANMFNSAPADDEELILAKIKVKAENIANDKSLSINPAVFNLYSSSNVKYTDFYSAVAPDPELRTELYSGAEHEGYVVFKVKKADTNPKIAYGLKYDGTGGIWFNLQ